MSDRGEAVSSQESIAALRKSKASTAQSISREAER
jgi:hypothetical protein